MGWACKPAATARSWGMSWRTNAPVAQGMCATERRISASHVHAAELSTQLHGLSNAQQSSTSGPLGSGWPLPMPCRCLMPTRSS